ncbi:O-antigen ligase family protein [Verrucomicrobiota bacterium]
MNNKSLPPLNARVINWIAVMLGLLMTLMVARFIKTGQAELLIRFVSFVVVLFILLRLDDKYWLAVPFSLTINFPLVPFQESALSLAETVVPVAFLFFILRVLLRKKRVLNSGSIFVVLYFLLVLAAFIANPVGFSVMGSEYFGARLYYKVLLGFMSFFIISNQKIHDKDSRLIIAFFIIGSFVSFLRAVLPYATNQVIVSEYAFYTWHQSMSVPAVAVIIWLLSRYPLAFSFSPIRRQSWLFAGCMLITLISGKRAAFATAAIGPFIVAWQQRKFKFIITAVMILSLLLAGLVWGNNRVFRLPSLVQRTLIFLPGRWDSRLMNMKKATFRTSMRRAALSHLRKNPVKGRFGFHINSYELYSIMRDPTIEEKTVAIMATGAAWHSTWLGILADLGISGAVLWALFLMHFIRASSKSLKIVPPGTSAYVLCRMISLILSFHIIRSYTSWDSSSAPLKMWWLFGVVIAINNTRKENKEVSAPAELPEV